MTGCMVS